MNSSDIERLHSAYVECRQKLFTYALSLTANRDCAEDILHGVFERLLERPSLPHGLQPYLFRAVRNAAFDDLRRRKVRRDSVFDLTTDLENRPAANEGSAAVAGHDLDVLLRKLSADERETLVLKVYSGLTFQGIASLRGVPLATVASWHRRGLERLKALLSAER